MNHFLQCPSTLANNHILGVPNLKDRHTCNWAVWIFKGRRVNYIASTDSQDNVNFWEMIIDFLHLLDIIVWDSDFSRQDVHLSRHTTSSWMNSKANFNSVFSIRDDGYCLWCDIDWFESNVLRIMQQRSSLLWYYRTTLKKLVHRYQCQPSRSSIAIRIRLWFLPAPSPLSSNSLLK